MISSLILLQCQWQVLLSQSALGAQVVSVSDLCFPVRVLKIKKAR